MLGSSAESLGRLTAELDAALSGGADGATISQGLFGAADVLSDQPALRRAATDPSATGEARAALAKGVFGSHLDAATVALVASAASLRWASSNHLASSLEQLAVVSLVKAADAAGEGDRLEGDLFVFGRAVSDNPELRDALSDPARTVADKQDLVRSLLEGKASAAATQLAARSVGLGRPVVNVINGYIDVAADTRNKSVALVRVARPLGDADQATLAEALSRQAGRPVHLNVVVDPSVLGGIHVEIGDDVIDGSIASRLDDAQRRLVG
jgi:F-type H+-transporting ATPase subunit delta